MGKLRHWLCVLTFICLNGNERIAKGSYIQDVAGLCFHSCLLCKIVVGGKVEEGRRK